MADHRVLGVAGSWLSIPKPRDRPQLRLFCFPFAGGGGLVYRSFHASLPDSVEVCAVQLPGRESRFRDPLVRELPVLVSTLAEVLKPAMDVPFALFGHSLGARLSFELARELRRLKRPGPACLFVSARRAPQLPAPHPPMYLMPEAEFRERLRQYEGTPEIIFKEAELMDIFSPILRADFMLNEATAYVPEEPLACPIVALGGTTDKFADRTSLEAWREQTRAGFAVETFPGHHFYLQQEPARSQLLRSLSGYLARIMAGAAI